jgi:hypothetical protein
LDGGDRRGIEAGEALSDWVDLSRTHVWIILPSPQTEERALLVAIVDRSPAPVSDEVLNNVVLLDVMSLFGRVPARNIWLSAVYASVVQVVIIVEM